MTIRSVESVEIIFLLNPSPLRKITGVTDIFQYNETFFFVYLNFTDIHSRGFSWK